MITILHFLKELSDNCGKWLKDKTREVLKSKKNPNCYYLFEDRLDEYKTRGERLEEQEIK